MKSWEDFMWEEGLPIWAFGLIVLAFIYLLVFHFKAVVAFVILAALAFLIASVFFTVPFLVGFIALQIIYEIGKRLGWIKEEVEEEQGGGGNIH